MFLSLSVCFHMEMIEHSDTERDFLRSLHMDYHRSINPHDLDVPVFVIWFSSSATRGSILMSLMSWLLHLVPLLSGESTQHGVCCTDSHGGCRLITRQSQNTGWELILESLWSRNTSHHSQLCTVLSADLLPCCPTMFTMVAQKGQAKPWLFSPL